MASALECRERREILASWPGRTNRAAPSRVAVRFDRACQLLAFGSDHDDPERAAAPRHGKRRAGEFCEIAAADRERADLGGAGIDDVQERARGIEPSVERPQAARR